MRILLNIILPLIIVFLLIFLLLEFANKQAIFFVLKPYEPIFNDYESNYRYTYELKIYAKNIGYKSQELWGEYLLFLGILLQPWKLKRIELVAVLKNTLLFAGWVFSFLGFVLIFGSREAYSLTYEIDYLKNTGKIFVPILLAFLIILLFKLLKRIFMYILKQTKVLKIIPDKVFMKNINSSRLKAMYLIYLLLMAFIWAGNAYNEESSSEQMNFILIAIGPLIIYHAFKYWYKKSD